MAGRSRAIMQVAAILTCSIGLSGCIAAAVPLLAAEGGLIGFSGYKLVQTETGGSVGVRFGPKDSKQQPPPEPLPDVKRVAVWPADESEVMFANDLENAGRFTVTPPDKVSSVLTHAGIGTNTEMLTDQEMDAGYASVCRATGTELVFASKSRGIETNANVFSFSRPTETFTADLTAYSCRKHAVIWRDTLNLIVAASEEKIPSSGELNGIAAKAWADRVASAMNQATAAK